MFPVLSVCFVNNSLFYEIVKIGCTDRDFDTLEFWILQAPEILAPEGAPYLSQKCLFVITYLWSKQSLFLLHQNRP